MSLAHHRVSAAQWRYIGALRCDSSWELRIFSLSHARDKMKKTSFFFNKHCTQNFPISLVFSSTYKNILNSKLSVFPKTWGPMLEHVILNYHLLDYFFIFLFNCFLYQKVAYKVIRLSRYRTWAACLTGLCTVAYNKTVSFTMIFPGSTEVALDNISASLWVSP